MGDIKKIVVLKGCFRKGNNKETGAPYEFLTVSADLGYTQVSIANGVSAGSLLSALGINIRSLMDKPNTSFEVGKIIPFSE